MQMQKIIDCNQLLLQQLKGKDNQQNYQENAEYLKLSAKTNTGLNISNTCSIPANQDITNNSDPVKDSFRQKEVRAGVVTKDDIQKPDVPLEVHVHDGYSCKETRNQQRRKNKGHHNKLKSVKVKSATKIIYKNRKSARKLHYKHMLNKIKHKFMERCSNKQNQNTRNKK